MVLYLYCVACLTTSPLCFLIVQVFLAFFLFHGLCYRLPAVATLITSRNTTAN
ncbi:uncharacterized protein LACBIDRAFT_317894 [Laccaria bicolor S238N-H82]|uniref:Predicted protein n=1 Tax=Laccaria bicolor (strain S238N-H82 / ATCC MYA-4686) TaxID=486041 RepID=B0D5G7_LACBS|nr:uncharacterized protein LACBIDRAFT_317894 [Laccaria bicolor S238N-H82]EDR10017.1 predicted protein [Laccaria bicolor S238N-H82]|eukprot:XP_001879402.1 predicted protein [Laccaria bicolor S238N-H82]